MTTSPAAADGLLNRWDQLDGKQYPKRYDDHAVRLRENTHLAQVSTSVRYWHLADVLGCADSCPLLGVERKWPSTIDHVAPA